MRATDEPDPSIPTDDDHKGLKEKVTEVIDTVKDRIHEYHEDVDNPD